VKHPKYAFALLGRRFEVLVRARVHPAAMIAPGALLGAGCSVGAGTVIEDGAVLGWRCWIGCNVTIHGCVRMGDDCVVQSGAVLGAMGFGYVRGPDGRHVRFPQIGTLRIGDNVEIGANTTIDRGALGETRIGRGTKIDNLCHIAHNCVVGEDVLMAAQVGMAGSCVIEDGAMLGGQVGLGERVTIGKGVVLGGQGGVLPGKRIDGEGVVYWGTPAQPVREYLRGLARLRKG
jgi:UDP-3-O-[3-hydroxymyristoyl] glucosamine N-acyltransferase